MIINKLQESRNNMYCINQFTTEVNLSIIKKIKI